MPTPAYSLQEFLGYLFAPSKNARPKGVRRESGKLKSTKQGRIKSRINAWNRMSAVNQNLIKAAGARELYLTGGITLDEAKRGLRQRAIDAGIARPTRTQKPTPRVVPARPLTRREQVEQQVARHLKITLARAGRPFKADKIDERVPKIPEYIIDDVTTWDYPQIKEAASHGGMFDYIENGTRYNPFWYN